MANAIHRSMCLAIAIRMQRIFPFSSILASLCCVLSLVCWCSSFVFCKMKCISFTTKQITVCTDFGIAKCFRGYATDCLVIARARSMHFLPEHISSAAIFSLSHTLCVYWNFHLLLSRRWIECMRLHEEDSGNVSWAMHGPLNNVHEHTHTHTVHMNGYG